MTARSEATSDLRDEGLGMRKVLHDKHSEDTPERRVPKAERPTKITDTKDRVHAIARRSSPSDLHHFR